MTKTLGSQQQMKQLGTYQDFEQSAWIHNHSY
jgi:hypothetical protein